MRELVLDDPTLGRRRLVLDGHGLPVSLERADGTRLDLERADGTLAIRRDGRDLIRLSRDRRDNVVATDADGCTFGRVSPNTAELTRGAHQLRFEATPDGRLARVGLPGSGVDLEYRPAGPDRWSIGPAGGRPLLEVADLPDGLQVTCADGTGWIECRRGWVFRVTTIDGSPLATVTADGAGRVTRRAWAGGATHRYERDIEGRLVAWEVDGHREVREYEDGNVAAIARDGERVTIRSDDGRRVESMAGTNGRVTYAYDANGARVARQGPQGRTTYRYDALGHLVEVVGEDGASTRFGWDALGRRLWVDHGGRRLYEHRGPHGRVWAVTDEDGRAVHTFVWWGDRVLARIDGPVDAPLAEVYLCDGLGTLLGLGRPGADGLQFDEAIQPPFGAVRAPWRPTLFGHIADGATQLICFGARELDPETGCFLTPDPWHGGADDPRRLAGAPRAAVQAAREFPLRRVHPYALSGHDPVGCPDLDGHTWYGSLLRFVLRPTWGFPLTSLSIFGFVPLNVWFEVLGLVLWFLSWLFGSGKHPWPHHSMWNSRGPVGSRHLDTYGLALDGFLPRWIAAGLSFKDDRAITVGYVPWENRRFFQLLERPQVLELENLRPPAGGAGLSFSDRAAGSVVAVIDGAGGRERLHVAWWTRGAGNAVAVRGAFPSFEDQPVPPAVTAKSTILLAHPLPEAFPKSGLKVVEYLTAGGHSSAAELVHDVLFALVPRSTGGPVTNDLIQVKASGPRPAFAVVKDTVPAEKPVLILDHELPARFASHREKLHLRRMKGTGTTSPGWTAIAAPGPLNDRVLSLANPPHAVAVDDVFDMTPTGGGLPAGRMKVCSRVEIVRVRLKLAAPGAAALGIAGTVTMSRLERDGNAVTGKAAGANATRFVLTTKDHGFAKDEILEITLDAGGAAKHFAKITLVTSPSPATPATPTTPATPAVPPSVTVDTASPFADAAGVKLARVRPSGGNRDMGTDVTHPGGDSIIAKVRTTELFRADMGVSIDVAGTVHVRRIEAVESAEVQVEDPYVGTGPFNVEVVVPDPAASEVKADMASDRFVKHTGGADLPSAYGAYPDAVVGFMHNNRATVAEPTSWQFYVKAAPGPGFHPEYKNFWRELTLGADHYWLLSSPLPVVKDGSDFLWEPDRDDTTPGRPREKMSGAPNPTLQVQEMVRATPPVERIGVIAKPAEAQVPDTPTKRWSLADALDEHELAHTLQNTYMGPMMTGLPVQGLTRAMGELWPATGAAKPDWLPFENPDVSWNDMNFFEAVSMHGLLKFAWATVVMQPLIGAEALLGGSTINDWVTKDDIGIVPALFNPVNSLLLDRLPEIDPNAGDFERWSTWTVRLAASAFDMRSWIPLIGFVFLLLPDGPRSFLEQQASRWSGDLYSTILSVNDRFNIDRRFKLGIPLPFAGELKDADVTVQVGGPARLMTYAEDRADRLMPLNRCDQPGSPLRYIQNGSDSDVLTLKQLSTAGSLVPAELYRRTAGPAVVRIQIGNPPAVGGTSDFLQVPQNAVMIPTLRSVVPIPPAVVRTAGCYLVGGAPGQWRAESYSFYATRSDSAKTHQATVTFESEVTLGKDPVPWTMPPAHPAAPPPATIKRFITEKQNLVVKGRDTRIWIIDTDAAIATRVIPHGWELTMSAGGFGLPHQTRVRIWAKLDKNDALFDLQMPDVPSLAGRRTYLAGDLYIPVRDFHLEVEDLPVPAATPAEFKASEQTEVALKLKLAGPGQIASAPGNVVKPERVGDDPPRGEKWRFKVPAGAVEEDTNVTVTFTFAAGVTRQVALKVKPNFTMTKAGAPPFEAKKDAPLELTLNGGTAPYKVQGSDPPWGTIRVTAPDTVTITVNTPPPAAVGHEVKVKDHDGALGIRKVMIRP